MENNEGTTRKVTRRTAEERIAAVDAKIEFHKEAIKQLQAKKEELLHPAKRLTKTQKMQAVVKAAAKAGLSPEDMAEKLGVELN